MLAATFITNKLGMSHPKTIPTCPPETRGNESVEETDAITPMILNANATVSKNYDMFALARESDRRWKEVRTENSRLNSALYPSSASILLSALCNVWRSAR